jgi:hypothetical protein
MAFPPIATTAVLIRPLPVQSNLLVVIKDFLPGKQ